MKNATMSRNGKTRNGRTTLQRVAVSIRHTIREMDRAAMVPALRARLARAVEDIEGVRASIPKGVDRRAPEASASDFLDEMERRRRACDADLAAAVQASHERLLWTRRYADERKGGKDPAAAAGAADVYVECYREGVRLYDEGIAATGRGGE